MFAWLAPSPGVLGQCARVRFPASLLKAVAEVDDAAAESVLVDELEIGAGVGWQCGVAPTEDDWPDEQGELVDQPGDESLCCEVRATDQQIPTGGGLQVEYRARGRSGVRAECSQWAARPGSRSRRPCPPPAMRWRSRP